MKIYKDNVWLLRIPANTFGILFNAGDGDNTKSENFSFVNKHVYTKSGGDQGFYSGHVDPDPGETVKYTIHFHNNVGWDNIQVKITGVSPAITGTMSSFLNSSIFDYDFEAPENASLYCQFYTLAGSEQQNLTSQFKVVDGVLEISHPNEKQGWEVQVNYENDFEEGQTYFLEIRLKGSVAGNFSAGLQNPDGYKGCGDFSPNFNVTTEWQTVTVSTKCNGPGAKRCLLNIGNYAGTLYFDSYRIYTTKESNVLPMTPEEKHEVLSKALYAWIDGMMEACEGQVVAWDVTNEVMSGSDQDGDGFYEPWNFSNTNAEDQKNNFYWAEHIGALDVVRLPVKYARECFEKHGGDPSKLKLFVNDYNLESFWDDNKKVKSYAHWIQKWEEEEGVVIDGVSSQMHISYEENPEALENRKHHIRQMFEIMAATGKLVRVSELDMGYNDANGTALKTEQLTEEQHKAMAEYYKWIIKTYFDVVPANQQYGICHWCPTDAPAESGWRGGEPVGLWDLNYNRKWTFTGVADGLANKE